MHRAIPALLALATLAAGCTGSPSPASEPPAPEGLAAASEGASQPGPAPGPGPAGSPVGGTAGGAGEPETPATAWVRAFWGDRMEAVLVDATGSLAHEGDLGTVNCTLGCYNAFFLPDEGAFVAPGTATVEVTASWSPPPTAPEVRMIFVHRTAADAEAVGDVFGNGETRVLEVGPEDADAPLARVSQWWFGFFPHADPAGTIPPMEIEVRIVAKRGPGALPVFGGPPDPWQGRSELPLASGSGEQRLAFTPATFSCLDCRRDWDASGPSLVAPGAQRIVATATWDWPGPAKPRLHYWNPLAQDGENLMEVLEDGEGTRTFLLEGIAPEHLDSPYQRRSSWAFIASFEGGPVPAGAALGTLELDVRVQR